MGKKSPEYVSLCKAVAENKNFVVWILEAHAHFKLKADLSHCSILEWVGTLVLWLLALRAGWCLDKKNLVDANASAFTDL